MRRERESLAPSPLPRMRAHAPVILCSGFTYIIVNRETRLVLDDPVGEGESVTVNRLSENDTQKVRCSASYRYHLRMRLTSPLRRSGYSLRTEAAFGLSRTSETASSFALRNSTRRTETLLSQNPAIHGCAAGPLSLKTA